MYRLGEACLSEVLSSFNFFFFFFQLTARHSFMCKLPYETSRALRLGAAGSVWLSLLPRLPKVHCRIVTFIHPDLN